VTMGSRDDLAALLAFLGTHDLRPTIALEVPLTDTARGIGLMAEGTHFGKVVVLP